MDRLVASQVEIDIAQSEQGYGPLPVEQIGLTPEEAGAYQEMVNEAKEQAETSLTSDLMQE